MFSIFPVDSMRVTFVYVSILVAFFAIAVALHYPGFHSPMIYDSVGFIQEFEYVFAARDILAVIGLEPARPLSMITLYANYLIGGMDTRAFRVINAFVLACAGTSLALLVTFVLALPGAGTSGIQMNKRIIGAVAGFLFVIHPLQSLTVLYIWQREALMACLFFFTGLGVYLAARTGWWIRPIPGYVATSLIFFGGMLSKENCMTFPLVLVLAEIVLLRQSHGNQEDSSSFQEGSGKEPRLCQQFGTMAKRVLLIAAITVPPFLTSLALTQILHEPDANHPREIVTRLQQYYHVAGLTTVEVALTQCRLVFWYLFTIIAPFLSGVDLLAPCAVSTSPWNPPATLAAVAGVGALVVCGLALARKHPAPSFGIFFFFITLGPESLLIPQYLFCGYRAILPMAGVLILIAVLVCHVVASARLSVRTVTFVVLGLLSIGLAATTITQARAWNPLDIWKTACDRMPPFSRQVEATPYLDILGGYATELKKSGDYDQAILVLNRLLAIDSPPNQFKKTLALVNKGLALIAKGDKSQGLAALKHAHASDSTDFWACFQLADALLDQGAREEGVEMLKKSMTLNPRYLPTLLRLAHVMRESGRLDEAIPLFAEAAAINPRAASIQNALGAALEASGKVHDALKRYRQAVHWEPESAAYHFNLANCLARTGNIQDAITLYQRAVQLNPSLGPAHANLGTLLLAHGRARDALESLKKALAIIPDNAGLHVQAATALMALDRHADARAHLDKALAIDPHHASARQHLDRLVTKPNAVTE